VRRSIACALSTTALAAASALALQSAAAADPDWDELAQCESGGNWQSTAGHYEGGIQFDPHTWDAYGGGQYAPSANQATREQQIAIGRKVLAAQGYGAWPGCSAKTGWESGGQSVRHVQPKPRKHHNAKRTERTETVRSAPVAEQQASQVQRIVVPRQAMPTLDKVAKVPAGGSMWTVARGDTLTSIAAKTGADWKQIQELNRDVVEHPDWIFPGERLVIPAPTR
jgi:LysM repeat protein